MPRRSKKNISNSNQPGGSQSQSVQPESQATASRRWSYRRLVNWFKRKFRRNSHHNSHSSAITPHNASVSQSQTPPVLTDASVQQPTAFTRPPDSMIADSTHSRVDARYSVSQNPPSTPQTHQSGPAPHGAPAHTHSQQEPVELPA